MRPPMNAAMRTEGRLPPPSDEQVDLAVDVLRMLADGTRLRLLWLLSEDELSVTDLAEQLARPSSGVSQHLSKLRVARLVRARRQGTQVFYRLENSHVRQLVQDAVFHADHAVNEVPAHHATTSAEPPSPLSGEQSTTSAS